jgi:23S rRNA pseudouridine1911/1915/1917 synthase
MDYHYHPLWETPRILDEAETYLVLYKPPLMFSAPLGGTAQETLLDWCARRRPLVLEPKGAKPLEGGLLHRLDFETEGLVLVATTQGALESFRAQQEAGDFVKDYSALTRPVFPVAGPRPSAAGVTDRPGFRGPPGTAALPGFPPAPGFAPAGKGSGPCPGTFIESFFRPWGPGRRAVRPVIRLPAGAAELPKGRGNKNRPTARDRGGYYRTEILARKEFSDPSSGRQDTGPGLGLFRLRIRRGFRHQIRCHLAWIGEPILNDALYGGMGEGGREEPCPIALRAAAFSFFDPLSGEQKNYRLPFIDSR